MSTPAEPLAVVRTRAYAGLLVFAAVLGVVVSALAYWYLKLISDLQRWVFHDLPHGVGFASPPTWWPFLPLLVAGVVVGVVVQRFPGRGGHSPADGFQTGGAQPGHIPGIILASLASLGLGAVLGPEAPLIALGGALALLAVRLARRDTGARVGAVVAATGSFAAIATVLGSPLTGAFLLLEASGLGGATAAVALLPGLLGAGIGSLVFVGFNSATGYGTFSLTLPHLPHYTHPTGAELGWSLLIGAAAAVACVAIRRLGLLFRPVIEGRLLLLTPCAGLLVAALACGYAQATGHETADVLFSGQDAAGPLVLGRDGYTVNALLLLMVCKAVAFSLSLAAFRGGPTFPAVFIGAAGAVALSHLPGLSLVPALAAAVSAMAVGMLGLPMASVLLATLILGDDAVPAMPLAIVAVVTTYVLSQWMSGWLIPRRSRPAPAAGSATPPPPDAGR